MEKTRIRKVLALLIVLAAYSTVASAQQANTYGGKQLKTPDAIKQLKGFDPHANVPAFADPGNKNIPGWAGTTVQFPAGGLDPTGGDVVCQEQLKKEQERSAILKRRVEVLEKALTKMGVSLK